MPRYYFHVYHNGDEAKDAEGVELLDDRNAWTEATSSCGQMIQDLDGTLGTDADWRMEVTDAEGAMIFRLRLTTEHRPG